MEYPSDIVENMLRNYYTLQFHDSPEFSDMFVDLMMGLKELNKYNSVLYYTIISVFVNGTPIQDQALNDGVSPRMISYRLNDALSALTNFMNGELVNVEG